MNAGTSIAVNGSVHSTTSVPPTGIVRSAFLARNTGCGQRRSSTVSFDVMARVSIMLPARDGNGLRCAPNLGSKVNGHDICIVRRTKHAINTNAVSSISQLDNFVVNFVIPPCCRLDLCRKAQRFQSAARLCCTTQSLRKEPGFFDTVIVQKYA